MGIQGLLPLLKSIELPITMAELSGNTVGVDAYCWLHKGVYGCALQLAEGKESDVYINYVIRRVNMMLYHKVKPIMVFDGGYLPSKKDKETERRNKRKEFRTQGLSHLQHGNKTKALECFQRSIDITPEMAYNVIKACREKGVDCIVAPYEADAQLAYLMKTGTTQFTISEDSDLLVYGCEKVIFKMDANGSGLLINIKNLPMLTGLRMDGFTEKKFREMCILSGCDYLQSVKGMGLITSHKLLRKHSTVNKLIRTLRLNNKMNVPSDYEAKFLQAEQTFLYQIVFDPKTNKLVPLNPIPDDLKPTELHFAGHNGIWKEENALQLALGNLNPITGRKIGNFRATKVISSVENEQVLGTDKPRKKAQTTSWSPSSSNRNKGPHSVMSSNKEYEAKRNLNGPFRETKSSENTNKPFVTPMRAKRRRSEDDNVVEKSRLTKLYSTTDDIAEHSYSDYKTEDKKVAARPMKRPHNPFRSPVIPGKQQPREHVVSRYFGLAGMETTEQKKTTLDGKTFNETVSNNLKEDDDDNDESINEAPTTVCSQISTDSSSPSQDTSNTSQSQKSNHSLPSMDSSPTGNSSQLSNNNDTTPRSSKTNFFFTNAKMGTRTKYVHGKHQNGENRKPPKKKIKSGQTSLDKFAFVRNTNKVNFGETKSTLSPNRSVLGSFSINCQLDRATASECSVDEEENNENDGEFIEDSNVENVHRNLFGEPEEKSQTRAITHEPKPKQIVLHTKPSTGLSRCRPVGLSRPRTSERKKTGVEALPNLAKYFEYRGRSARTIAS